MKQLFHWAARISSILFTVFLVSFSFDTTLAGHIEALLMNLLPALIVVIATIIAWKMPRLGGWLFIALGAAFLLLNGVQDLIVYFFAVPPLLIGVIYLADYYAGLPPREKKI